MAVITAPPPVLTMDEYRAHYEPEGWQLLIIGPTSTWRQEWGEWEAIRDIIQNALDEAEAYRTGYDSRGLWIADRGRGVAVADFLLGPPKLKPDWARGKYGEGLKVGCLALIRKGYPVHVETVGRELWVIFLEQKVDGAAQTLAALWRPDGAKVGTKFHIIGYTGSAYKDRFAINLPREAIVAEGPSPLTQPVRRFNQLIQYDFPGSRIFARDIYMREINSQFSYNLWGFEMAPDRHGPKRDTDVWVDMGRLWCCVTKVELLEKLLQMVADPPLLQSDESRNIQMSYSMGTESVTGKPYVEFIKENASVWREAWSNVFGESAVVRTSDRYDGTVKHLGYQSMSVQWHTQDTLAEVIMTDKSLVKASQEKLRETVVIPDSKLSHRQLVHLRAARAIADRWATRPVSGVYAAIIPPASERKRTAGLYSRVTEEIDIALDQLEHCQSTIDTTIHELAHHVSGAEDLEEAHSNAMTHVAAMVVRLTSEGKFDDVLKEAVW